jgi:ribonuclease T2
VPDASTTYDLDDIMKALTTPRGVSPVVACQGSELREVWYHFNVRGSVQQGTFEPREPELPAENRKDCPQKVRYLPKDE